jgi:hypothetical protein
MRDEAVVIEVQVHATPKITPSGEAPENAMRRIDEDDAVVATVSDQQRPSSSSTACACCFVRHVSWVTPERNDGLFRLLSG